MKTVSVIIPIYNASNSIIDCMDSVRHQTYLDYEVILINDGSSDDSLIKVQNYIKRYHLEDWHVISRENLGVSHTRNEGVCIAQGEYIAFLDSDDMWDKRKLERQMAFVKEHDASIVGGKFSKINGQAYWKYQLNDLLYHNYVLTSTVLIRKSAIVEVGLFDETMRYSEDYNLWLKLAIRYPIYILNEQLAVYDILKQGGGLSSHLWNMEKGELSNYRYLKKHNHISSILYIKVCIYSLSKFMLRVIKRALKRR